MIHTDGKPTIVSGRFAADKDPAKLQRNRADAIAAGFGPLLRTAAKREAKGDR